MKAVPLKFSVALAETSSRVQLSGHGFSIRPDRKAVFWRPPVMLIPWSNPFRMANADRDQAWKAGIETYPRAARGTARGAHASILAPDARGE